MLSSSFLSRGVDAVVEEISAVFLLQLNGFEQRLEVSGAKSLKQTQLIKA